MQVLLYTYGSTRTIRSMARPHPTTSVRPSIRPSCDYTMQICSIHHTDTTTLNARARPVRCRYFSIYIWIDTHSAVRGSAPPHHIHPPVHPNNPIHPLDREIIPCKSATYTTHTTLHARARPVRCKYFNIHMDRHAQCGPWLGPTAPHPSHPIHPIHPFDREIIPCKFICNIHYSYYSKCTRAAGIDLPAPKCLACVAPQPRPAREAAPWAAARPADRARSGAQDTGARCHPSCVCACAMLRCVYTWLSIHPSIHPSTPSTCLPTYLPIYPPVHPSTSHYQHREA